MLDHVHACAVVLVGLRLSIGLRSNSRRAAATLAHHVVLLGRAQRCCEKRQISPRRLMVTPTCRSALHRLDGRSDTNGGHMTGSIRIGSAPASATAAALKALESTLRHRPTAAPPEAPGRLGESCGNVSTSGHCGALTRWHGLFSRSQKLEEKASRQSRANEVDLFRPEFCGYARFGVTNHPYTWGQNG